MRSLNYLLFLIFILLLSCTPQPTQVKVSDDNEDAVAHLVPNPDIMGNTEIFFIPGTIQGSAIWVINGPGANVGLDIRDKSNPSFIYFADSYITSSGNTAQTGTQIPWNRWLKVRLVVYKSGLSGFVVSFLDALGLDFFDSLQDYMVEAVYENEVYLNQSGKRFSTKVIDSTHLYKHNSTQVQKTF